ncbi:unnamed protein product [Cylicostephanus goldi]|uniref:Uncharacterized protein n=1 Tax=Cylicostephanus goldi TaxID=71465 RepID=A0A3P6R1C1_CYLGO|nr:unnamed protein product [Cylicostephanus goldi]
MNGYKKTTELTDADCSDAHQKNYQQADASSGKGFLYKTAEWTNKDAKEAKITLMAQDALPPEKTRSAVYAFNICEAHGFSKDIAKKNIDFLLKNFDRVDIVRTGLFDDERVQTIENIKSFNDIKWPSPAAARAAGAWSSTEDKIVSSHRNIGLYDGLREYLSVHKPTCIYVSFDLFYVAQISFSLNSVWEVPEDPTTGVRTILDETMQAPELLKGVTTANGIPKTMDEDCFDILKRYKKEGRYFSMACDYDGKPVTKDGGTYAIGGDPENIVKINGKAEKLGRERFFYSANIIAALADPTVWPGREAAKKGLWNGEPYNPINPKDSNLTIAKEFSQKFQGFKGIAPDYPYNKDFATINISTNKCSLRITDTVADYFEIIEATSENPKAHIEVKGNTVSALLEDYDGTAPLIVTIRVKLSEKKRDVLDKIMEKWNDTNAGPAKMSFSGDRGEAETATVNSPKLFVHMGELSALGQGRLS